MLHLDSIVVCVDSPTEAERLTNAGGDVLHWRGIVPSHEGGDVTWASAVLRVPASVAVELGLITLGAELRGSPEQDASLARTAPTTTLSAVTQTSSGVPLVAPRRHRSPRPGRRRQRSITWHTGTKDRTPRAPTPGTMRP